MSALAPVHVQCPSESDTKRPGSHEEAPTARRTHPNEGRDLRCCRSSDMSPCIHITNVRGFPKSFSLKAYHALMVFGACLLYTTKAMDEKTILELDPSPLYVKETQTSQDVQDTPDNITKRLTSQDVQDTPDNITKRLAIALGVAVATGCTAGGMGIARGERNENEAFVDLASGEGLNINVMTRAEAQQNGIEHNLTPEETDVEIDAHIFHAKDNQKGQDLAEELKGLLEDKGIFDDLQVNELSGYDFGNHDLVVVRDIDPTSTGQTAAMIGLIAIGVFVLLAVLLKFTDNNLNLQQPGKFALAFGLGALGVGASVSAGLGLHFLSGDMSENMGQMVGCAVGFVAAVVLMVVVFSMTRGFDKFKVARHVIGAAALVGGFAILTNLAGEAFGETILDQMEQTITDIVATPSGLGGADVIMSGIPLLIGFFWFFFTFFQDNQHEGAPALRKKLKGFVVFGLGALATTGAVLGGAHMIAMDTTATIPAIFCFALAASIMAVVFVFANPKVCHRGH